MALELNIKSNKVVLYARVSTTGQSKHSIDAQLAAMTTFADHEGLEVVGQYVDPGISGTVPALDRPGLCKALGACEEQGAYLMVAKFDRLSRDVLEALLVENQLEKCGLGVLSASEANGKDPEHALMKNILFAVSSWERQRIICRISEGIKAAKKKGVMFGRPRAGFRRDAEGRLVKDVEKHALVRMLLVMRSGDKPRTYEECANILGWTKSNTYHIARSWASLAEFDAYTLKHVSA